MELRVRVTMTDGVADVRLSRPDKMNALDQAMFEALVETGSSLMSQRGLRRRDWATCAFTICGIPGPHGIGRRERQPMS